MKYRAKIAIDFGSTNTVITWKIYEVDEDGTSRLSPKLNTANNVKHVPTVMILRELNPDETEQDFFGADAVEVIRTANAHYVVSENFKQLIYTSPTDSDNYRTGVSLTKKFFGFLYQTCQRDIFGRLPLHATENMEKILCLSTPVRADPTHRLLMKNIAEEVGFNGNDNFTVSTDSDEAVCVIKYAIENAPNNMAGVVAKANDERGSVILFVDVGGSTMDMALLRVGVSPDTKILLDTISLWPNADEKYLLGGSLIDKALRDYFIDNGFAVKDHALTNWNEGDGKFRFRLFKEENNATLKSGKPISNLGINFSSALFDPYDDQRPAARYGKGNVITPEIFENVICAKYIAHMNKAFRSIFDEQRTLDGQGKVTAADVDAILITGAGSKLYFLKDVFLREENGFTAIRNQPERLLSDWQIDPSLCCALGALVDKPESVEIPGFSRDNYYMKICLYLQSDDLETFLRENPDMLAPDVKSISFKAPGVKLSVAAHNECIYETNIFELTKKFQALPVNPRLEKKISYVDYNDGRFDYVMLQIQLYRKDIADEYVKIGAPFIKGVSRNLKSRLGRWFKRGLETLTFGRYTANHTVRTNLKLNFKMSLSASYVFTAKAELGGDFFDMDGQTFQMDL